MGPDGHRDPQRLATDEQRRLLGLARDAIAARLERRTLDLPPATGGLARPAGAFVTITHADRLRGCIGAVEPTDPLLEVVARCAADAATRDPRFPPLPPELLPEVALEISVLGPLEPVTDPAAVEIGRHGLVVEQGRHHGLLLPQVPVDWRWSRETFLAQTCVKAGLPADAWRTGATLRRFQAFVFAE